MENEIKNLGRPSLYNEDIADLICAEIAKGLPMHKICMAQGMPGESTVEAWLRNNTEFQSLYARAKEKMVERFAEEIIDISDNGNDDDIFVEDIIGGGARRMQNSEWIQRSKLRVDSRKWLMSKLNPKKYGDRIESNVNLSIDNLANQLDAAIKAKHHIEHDDE